MFFNINEQSNNTILTTALGFFKLYSFVKNTISLK